MSSDAGHSHLLPQSPPALPLVFSLERVVFPALGQLRFFERFCQSVFFSKSSFFSSHGGADAGGDLLTAQLLVHLFHAGDHLSLAPGTEGLLPFMSQIGSQVLTLRLATVASSHRC